MSENVLKFIESELKKDPGVSNATLFAGAKLIDKSIGKLNPRQFHAKYPLQVKRRLAGTAGPGRKPKAARARVRKRPAPAASGGDVSAAVLRYVTRRLKANPNVTNADLFARACEIDGSVAKLSPRQFHAKYPLQVKRRLARAAAGTGKPAVAERKAPARRKPRAKPRARAKAAPAAATPSAGGGNPDAVRALLLNLARELAGAGTQAETIEVMARLDVYVDDIMRAARN